MAGQGPVEDARLCDLLDIIYATALEPPGGMVDGTKYWEVVNSYFVGTDNEQAESKPASDMDAARMELEADRQRRREMAQKMREAAEQDEQNASDDDDVG